MGTLLNDLRIGLRLLCKNTVLTAVALLTLTLGIGANTAVFTVVNAILFRPLPYPAADRLVAIWPGHIAGQAELQYLQQRARSYAGGAAAFSPGWGAVLTTADGAIPLSGAHVSANFFRVLGVSPVVGRTFRGDEAEPKNDQVVLLSNELWRSRFGGDPDVIGRQLIFDGAPYTVIGVMPPRLTILQADAEIWMPFEIDPTSQFYTGGVAYLVGRLAAQATPESAAEELRALVPDIRSTFHFENAYGRSVSVSSLQDFVVGTTRPPLLLLLGAAGFLVLIAGANVGNLLLARGIGRQQEMAVRSVLGASRPRLVRQLLVESLLLGTGGGVLGFGAGSVGVMLLKSLLPRDVPRIEEISMDQRAFLACAAISLLIGILAGLAPALLASRHDLHSGLRARGESDSRAGRRVRSATVALELALALVLTLGAGLMVDTLWKISRVDAGFDANHILSIKVAPTSKRYRAAAERSQYFLKAVNEAKDLPGVEQAGAIQFLPLTGYDWHLPVEIESKPQAPGATPFRPGYRTILGDYFQAMRIQLISGRYFGPDDIAGKPPVVIVNEAFARRTFGSGAGAIGQRIRSSGTNDQWAAIIGVAANVRYVSLTTPSEPEFLTDARQNPQYDMALVVRTRGEPMASARVLQDRIAALDASVALSHLRPMTEMLAENMAQRRAIMLLLLAFASIGVVLAAVGVYGVMNYEVAARAREIGIRMALGAQAGRILRMVVRQGAQYAVIGAIAGIVSAVALSRLIRSLLFEVSATDPVVYATLTVALIAIAALAGIVPATRAARSDPIAAIRSE